LGDGGCDAVGAQFQGFGVLDHDERPLTERKAWMGILVRLGLGTKKGQHHFLAAFLLPGLRVAVFSKESTGQPGPPSGQTVLKPE
jgi:hypothetical protein